jgi:hypothetical protein
MNSFCLYISFGFLALNFYFIKNRKLEFQYSFFWSAVSVILLVLSLNGKLLQHLADYAGIVYAPALLLLIGIILSYLMILYLMIVISDMKKKVKKLIQMNALLQDKVEERSM